MQVHTYEELTNSFRDVSSKCHNLISDGGKEITKLLSSSNRTLKVSKGAPAWKAYVDYIGDIVIDGLVECIIASVHRLTAQASPKHSAMHLLCQSVISSTLCERLPVGSTVAIATTLHAYEALEAVGMLQVDPENMAKHEIAPLLEIQLELVVPEIVWIPELGSGSGPGVRDMFNMWFKSFLEIATLMKRLDTGEGQ